MYTASHVSLSRRLNPQILSLLVVPAFLGLALGCGGGAKSPAQASTPAGSTTGSTGTSTGTGTGTSTGTGTGTSTGTGTGTSTGTGTGTSTGTGTGTSTGTGTGTSTGTGTGTSTGTGTGTSTGTGTGTSTGTGTGTSAPPTNSATVTLNASALSLPSSSTVNLYAAVSGNASQTETWFVDGVSMGNSTVGTLSPNGDPAHMTYTAPSSSGTHLVKCVATNSAGASVSGSTTLTVTEAAPAPAPTPAPAPAPAPAPSPTPAPTPVTLTLSPTTASVASGASTTFTATLTGTTNTSVAWSVDGVAGGNSAVGTISGAGVTATYTAPAAAGSHTVAATSAASASATASATITVTAPPATGGPITVTVGPSYNWAIGTGGTCTFTASVSGTSNAAVTWSVDGVAGGNSSVGTITSAGVYTAPSTTRSTVHTITAMAQADGATASSQRLLVTVSNTVVNAKNYGATGNGSTDDTSAINSALSAAGSGICYVPAGTYMINPEYGGSSHGLSVGTGQTLLLDPGATLQCITQTSGPSKGYAVVALGSSNGAIVGGTIIGDRVARNLPTFISNSGTDFEQGMGVVIANGTGNIALGVTAKNCSCDGFEVTNSGTGAFLISDCVSDNNRRQGLSITWASSGTVQYCTFSNTNGNDPACGIDIEPDAGCTVSNVMINACTFTGNKGGGFEGGPSMANGPTGANNAHVTGCTIQNCTFTNNGGSNYGIGGILWTESDTCAILNNTIQNNVDYGVAIYAGATNFTITGNTVTGNNGYGIQAGGSTGSSGECAGTMISNNTVKGNSGTQIYVFSSATGVTLGSNVTQ